MSGLPFHRPYARTRIVSRSAEDAADCANRGLPVLIAFSLIGLLLALNIMLRFPEIGALVAEYNQF
jgi:hypothetical protein